jgi:hypothetical protein
VRVRPWCEITIDGAPHGRSPTTKPITLAPGRHRLRCEQPLTGRTFERELELSPGERQVVTHDLLGMVAVKVGIGNAVVMIAGRTVPAGESVQLPPGRHRVELRKGDKTIAMEYVQVSARPCTLRDTPELACYED